MSRRLVELERLARLGAAVERMPLDHALARQIKIVDLGRMEFEVEWNLLRYDAVGKQWVDPGGGTVTAAETLE